MIDCCDVAPSAALTNDPGVMYRLRQCNFTVANGNRETQRWECDIVGAFPRDERLLEMCSAIAQCLLRRRGRSRGSGPMWSAMACWLAECERAGLRPVNVAYRHLRVGGGG